MSFAHPWWLAAGMLGCAALLWTWRRHDARQRAALAQFVSPHLQAQLTSTVSTARRVIKRALFAAAIALSFVALAQPQAGYRWEQVKRRGNDIIFAVDTSRSMLTPDVKPTRLARAKLAIDDFVGHLSGDAVGLVAFAGSAFLQTPITLDYAAFHDSLNALDTNIIPRGGTNISSAIREAQAALRGRAGSDKILILVTDGEDLEGDSLTAAKAAARQEGLKIFTVGVGTANGDLIPLPADQGGGFLRDREGHLVRSHLDESALKALAAATGGAYAPLGATGQGLDSIYQEALAPLAKHDLESRAQKVYTQRYQWPLCASLALLLSSLLMGTRRRIPSEEPDTEVSRSLERFAAPTAAALFGLCWLLPIHSAHASPESAAKAYKKGDFAAAEQDYSQAAKRNPSRPILQFDEGAAAYKAGDFPLAAQAFQASVNAAQSGDDKRLTEQEDAYYNLGNTLYRTGQKTEQRDARETIQSWTQAIKAYDAALQLRANDADSKFNRDLVKHKLEALEKAQSQQSQSKPSSQSQPSKPEKSQDQQSTSGSDSSKGSSSSKQQQQTAQSKSPSGGQQQGQQRTPAQHQAGAKASPDEQKNPAEQGAEPAQAAHAQQPGAPNQPSPAGGTLPRPDRGQSAADSRGGQTAQAADDRRVPGGMSPEEARELLDSVKSDERHLPSAPLAQNGANETAPDEPLKDW